MFQGMQKEYKDILDSYLQSFDPFFTSQGDLKLPKRLVSSPREVLSQGCLPTLNCDMKTAIFNQNFDANLPNNPSPGNKDNPVLKLPTVDHLTVYSLCQAVDNILITEPIVLQLKSPCIIVGDLHGHILDLVRIIKRYGLPDPNAHLLNNSGPKYVFLGDIVDRGEFSLECVLIIFLMKVLYPNNVYIIRGNHEFQCVCSMGGFYNEISKVYPGTPVFASFMKTFSLIPLAAVIDRSVILVHGGIGPSNYLISDLETIPRPLIGFGIEQVDSILWSDPHNLIEEYANSQRGIGVKFGHKLFNNFMDKNNFKLMIRGHECVSEGISAHFNGKCLTVFSASNYCGLTNNKGAVLELVDGDSCQYNIFTLKQLEYLKRDQVKFLENKHSKQTNKIAGILKAVSHRTIKYQMNKIHTSFSGSIIKSVSPPTTSSQLPQNENPEEDIHILSSLSLVSNSIHRHQPRINALITPSVHRISIRTRQYPCTKLDT
ncbi:Ser/Thr protein phosphatase [Tritrichomonas foetus]|uniref:Serine/threonine-protein phosphatase n=1 Tax=Tritrichomonas foetus TaxID=1144522 RepID=A0A1J4KX06_9EUKA|nr:Ser/Thr protein phosphatase [Tritrichomonas foetus]|eukprot:OHT14236.1 Ser/Thr protein phosphatase [Tritrichomonas foetus]